MKRILFALALLFLIPQVTLAAWWNPFSWRIFTPSTRNNQTTQELEKKIQELEKQVTVGQIKNDKVRAENTSKPDLKPKKSVELKTNKANIQTPDAATPKSFDISNPPVDTEQAYADINLGYSNLRRELAEEYKNTGGAEDLEYRSYLLEKNNAVNDNLAALADYKKVTPKLITVLNDFSKRLAALDGSFKAVKSERLRQKQTKEEQQTRNTTINYIKTNKSSLYLPAIHVQVAALLDTFDRQYGTQYVAKFKTTKTQIETIEFANSFLLDMGETIEQ